MKRLLSLVLASVMSLSLVTAKTEAKLTDTQPTQFGTVTLKDANLNQPGTLPIVKKEATIKLTMPTVPVVEDFKTNEMTLHIQKRTGIKLDFTLIPNAEYLQKVVLMVAAGGNDLGDVLTGPSFAQTNIMEWANAKAIVPVTDYINNKMDYWTRDGFTKTDMSYDEAKRYVTMYDGNIYGPMSIQESFNNEHSPARIMMYQPWLDKLGLKLPNTTDELVTVLKAFRDKDPNGNGQKDEIPLTTAKDRIANTRYTLMTPFEYTQENYYKVDNGKVSFAFTTPGWREGIRYVKGLISEKLLSPLFLTQDLPALAATLTGKETVAGSVVNISMTNMPAADKRRYEYRQMPTISGPSGKKIKYWSPSLPMTKWLVTKNSKNPEMAFMLGDFINSAEVGTITRFGFEGKQWKKWEPGDPESAWTSVGKKSTLVNFSSWGVLQNVWWGQSGPSMFPAELFYGQVSSAAGNEDPVITKMSLELEIDNAKKITDAHKYVDKNLVIAGLIFNEKETDVIKEYQAVINTYVNECWARFITGDMDIEKEWDSYIKELDKMGIAKYAAAVQSCYDRMNKK